MTITLLDGGMGQELVARSTKPPTGLWSTQFIMDQPDLISAVHDDYFAAGAEVATTSTYAVHRDRLAPFDVEHLFESLHETACKLAVASRDNHGSGKVAGSLGPSGWSYRPDLAAPAEQAAELFAEIARLHAPYVDLHICETMSSVDQARGAVMGASVTGKPVWLAISVDDDNGKLLRSGEPVADVIPLLAQYEIAALLVNCSTPEAIGQTMVELAGYDVPIGGYANGFVDIAGSFKEAGSTVDKLETRTNLGPTIYAEMVAKWVADGATIIGGCCEVGPAHIRELATRYK